MQNPYLSLLSTAWKYARKERSKFVFVYSLFVFSNIALASYPLLYGWFIDGVQREGAEVLKYAWIYALAFVGLKLVEWAFHGPARVMERKLAFNLSENYIQEHYHKIVHMPVAWHEDNHSGSTINRIRKGYEAIKDFFQNGFIYLYAFGRFFFSFIAIIYFSPLFGSIAIGLGVLTAWIIIQFDKPYIKSVRDVNEKEHKLTSSLFDSLSNIITVITLRLEKRMEQNIMSKVRGIYPAFLRNVLVNEWKWFVAQLMIAIIYAVIVFGYVYQHYKPNEVFLIGGLITLIGFVNQFNAVFNDIAAQWTRLLQYHTDVKAAADIVQSFDSYNSSNSGQQLGNNWNTLHISNLNFKRDNVSDEYFAGLKQIELNLERGKRIAFIGESGSGKSTAMSILRGLYQPEQGCIVRVDGRKSAFNEIGNSVTLFPQEPEIFEHTIAYNISLGLPFSDQEIEEVLATAHFKDVLKQLPNGFDTHIKEKGVNLSGGQKQRLALARGILAARSSSIILLDEPTSSVDPKTELMIYRKMFRLFSDKCIISSLHRLHLLPMFDYIYVMDKGRIIAHGTFRELKDNNLMFQQMYEHQQGELTMHQ